MFIQIGLKVFLGQTMISTRNRCFGVGDDNVQPVKKARIRITGFVIVGVAYQRRDVTTVAITTNQAAMSDLFFKRLLVPFPPDMIGTGISTIIC